MIALRRDSPLHDEGGVLGGGSILLLHGLMGSARTWRRQLPWLRELGRVYTFDALGHGRPAPARPDTDVFVDDLLEHLTAAGPIRDLVVIGHSMGAIHGLCLAARRPELVRALVVEDIGVDFRGRTAADWVSVIDQWPTPFPSRSAVLDYFGPIAGRYFLESFRRTAQGYELHGEVEVFRDIAEEWGRRAFWDEWLRVSCPALLLEAEHTVAPLGQMSRMHQLRPGSRYVLISNSGHLAHDEQPAAYRGVVEPFVTSAILRTPS